jgi:TonB-dependent receptor
MDFPRSARRIVAGTLLLSAPLATRADTTGDAAAAAAAPAKANANAEAATESPRERGRVLQKRNPIASEYQAPGTLGRSPGASSDGEGNDFRRLLPATGRLTAAGDTAQLSLFGTYQPLAGKLSPGLDVLVRRRLGPPERPWALEVRANVTSATRHIEHYESVWAPLVEPGPDGRRPRTGTVPQTFAGEPVYFLERARVSQDVITTRTRSLSSLLEHRLSPTHTVFVQAAWSDYDDDFYRNRLEYNFGLGAVQPGLGDRPQDGTVVTEGAYRDAGARRYFGHTLTERDILRLQAGGRVAGPDWRADYAVYHATWVNRPQSDGWNFTDRGLDLAYRLDDPHRPTLAVTNGIDLSDTSRSPFNDLRAALTETRDTDRAARLDLERRLAVGGGTLWLGAGGLHREKERRNETSRLVYSRNPAAPLPLSAVEAVRRLGRVVRGFYALPPGLETAAIRRLTAAGSPAFAYAEARTTLESLQDRYTSEETVTGGYLLGSWTRGPWELEAGLRAERTRTATLGTVIAPAATDDGVGEEIARVTEGATEYVIRGAPGSNRYSTALPSLAGSLRLGGGWTLRGTLHEQVMRPQYFDIVRYRRVHPPTTSINEGNPDLVPVSIRTAALAADYRHERIGELSVEVYRTTVADFFYSAQRYEVIDGEQYNVARVENGDEGTVSGFQLQWSRSFALRGPVRRLAPALAYTFSDSEATVPTRPGDRLTLPERSRHLLRAELAWEAGRLGGAWEVASQSEALDEVGTGTDRDTYRGRVFSLDARLWWRLESGYRVTLSATNLTNAPERAHEGDPLRVTRNQYASTTWRLGVEATF